MNLLRKLLVLLILCSQTLSPKAQGHEGHSKIAIIDLERILAESVKGKALQERLAEFRNQTTQGNEKLLADISRLQETESENVSQINDLKAELIAYQQQRAQIEEQLQSTAIKNIEVALDPIFLKVKREGDYDLILNSRPGFVILRDDRIDVTNQVITLLDNSE